MEANKFSKLLDRMLYMFEHGPYQGGIQFDNEYYWIDGINPRDFALNATFHVYKGNVFMITEPHVRYECGLNQIPNENYFTLFVFGRNFYIDQTMGIELPEKYHDDFINRLRLGF